MRSRGFPSLRLKIAARIENRSVGDGKTGYRRRVPLTLIPVLKSDFGKAMRTIGESLFVVIAYLAEAL